jgi:osmotically inducible lipoprotein OsmB
MLGQGWDVTTLTRYCPGCHDRTLFCWKEEHRNGALTLLLVVVLWATVGCANMTPQHRRALSGGAIGAAGGAAGGAIIGGAAGVAAGALWDDINRALK